MITEDQYGPNSLRAFPDGVYYVTEHRSWAIADHADLLRRLTSTCIQYVGRDEAWVSLSSTRPVGSHLPADLGVTADGAMTLTCNGLTLRIAEHP